MLSSDNDALFESEKKSTRLTSQLLRSKEGELFEATVKHLVLGVSFRSYSP
jgi:hypothetical protein